MQLNVFFRKTDNKIKPVETTWDDIIVLFTAEHQTFPEKHQAKLFNAAEYLPPSEIPEDSDNLVEDKDTGETHTARRQVNLIQNHILVLDYDSDVTLEETLRRFKKYELVYYTSHSHMADDITHKFRVLIPFHKPVPSHKKSTSVGDWYGIIEPLKEFAGPGCDPKSFDPNQIYEMPSAPQERMHLAQSGHNKGTNLDWKEFEQTNVEPVSRGYSAGKGASVPSSGQHLDPDQILETDQGPIRVKDIVGKIDGVVCPFHNDKKGSEFVRKVESTENIFLFCKKCDCKYYMQEHEADSRRETTENPKKLTKKQKKIDQDKRKLDALHAEGIFDFDVVYKDAEDRSQVKEQLREIQKEIESDDGWKFVPENKDSHIKYVKNYASHIIYMPEGTGKSRLVIDIAKKGRNIIFACKSWEQAESKFKEYSKAGEEHGFKVDIVRSKDAKARRRFNTKVVRSPQRTPYRPGYIDDEASLDEFIKNNPDLSEEFIRLSWAFFTTDELSFESIPFRQLDENMNEVDDLLAPMFGSDTRVIVTSFEQLRIHRLKNVFIPPDWTIWFDDPDINDVIDIDPYDLEKWKELSGEKLPTDTKVINGKHYFLRDSRQSLGYPLVKYKCIYTTTEGITKQAIELMLRRRGENFLVHDQMNHIIGGYITILGTHKVRKRFDGLIPAISRRLFKMDFDNILIADGLAARWNHSNNKGRNDLSGENLLIELSIPHDFQVKTICDALDLNYGPNKREVRKQIMLDRLHQAIGRNSGYRYNGKECVVLVDMMFHKDIVKETRYMIDGENSVLIDRTAQMSRLDSRLSDTARSMVKQLVSLLNNIDAYVNDFRKCKFDIEFVLNNLFDSKKQQGLVVRVLASLCSYSDIDLGKEEEGEIPLQSKYRELANWILDTWIPLDQKQETLNEVEEILTAKPASSWTGDIDNYNQASQDYFDNLGNSGQQ